MATMKAITLWQPYASLVALSVKNIETRSWATKHRGPIAIHAAKSEPAYVRRQLFHPISRRGVIMKKYGLDFQTLPRGAVVAIANLVTIVGSQAMDRAIADEEQLLGDYSAGRFAWLLDKIEPIDPIACDGGQRVWNWDYPDTLQPLLERFLATFPGGHGCQTWTP